jgi:hypothetical protein
VRKIFTAEQAGRLLDAANHMETHPEHHSQQYFISREIGKSGQVLAALTSPGCGAAACAAGWLVALDDPQATFTELAGHEFFIQPTAGDLLDLSVKQSDALFIQTASWSTESMVNLFRLLANMEPFDIDEPNTNEVLEAFGFDVACSGSSQCRAAVHVHGCYAEVRS